MLFKSLLKKSLMLLMLLSFFSSVSSAQQLEDEFLEDDFLLPEQTKAPMQNIFFNVIWGSLAGGVLYVGAAALFDETESADEDGNGDSTNSNNNVSAKELRKRFSLGATAGGFLALGVSIYISYKNITFEKMNTAAQAGTAYDLNPLETEDLILRGNQISIFNPREKNLVKLPIYKFQF